MNRDIMSYARVYNVFDKQTCEQTISDIQDKDWEQHTFYNVITGQYAPQSGSKELDQLHASISTTDILDRKVQETFIQYGKDLAFPWFGKLQTCMAVKYNRYLEDRLMAEHCDHIYSLFDGEVKGVPILTAIGLLNDDFEGGNFVMFQDDIIELRQGDVLIFPSNFLFPHKVEPVTKGIRYSLVSWAV